MTKKVIYDFGANNGDDIPYYLLKADLVVAVEANPALCELILERFDSEIDQGRVVIENCVVTEESLGEVEFYVHKSNHVLSQLPPPPDKRASLFERVLLPSKGAADIVKAHGDPHYVKIDIERYDAQILRALFRAGVFPPFISAEAHSIEVFAVLVEQGHYDAFKLVDGPSVKKVYSNRLIPCDDGRQVNYSFPFHAAGPFGDDVDGEWETADKFMDTLKVKRLGWKDIHATNLRK